MRNQQSLDDIFQSVLEQERQIDYLKTQHKKIIQKLQNIDGFLNKMSDRLDAANQKFQKKFGQLGKLQKELATYKNKQRVNYNINHKNKAWGQNLQHILEYQAFRDIPNLHVIAEVKEDQQQSLLDQAAGQKRQFLKSQKIVSFFEQVASGKRKVSKPIQVVMRFLIKALAFKPNELELKQMWGKFEKTLNVQEKTPVRKDQKAAQRWRHGQKLSISDIPPDTIFIENQKGQIVKRFR